MLIRANISKRGLLVVLLWSLSLCPTSAQTLVIPVSEEACARCCSLVSFWVTNEAAQFGCQQAGCRGSQVNLSEAEAGCHNLFIVGGDGRDGCEVGRDFRFQGFSFLLAPDEEMFQCNQDGDLILNEPPVPPQILTFEQCSNCCTELNNGFDLVTPDDFDLNPCIAACSDTFFCDDDPNHRSRLGCAIGISFLTEGKVLLRETDRLFTCDAIGLTPGNDIPTNAPTKFPTNAPTGKPLITTESPVTTSPSVGDDGDDTTTVYGVSVFVAVLFAGVILGLVFRLRSQSPLLVKTDDGKVFVFAGTKKGGNGSGDKDLMHPNDTAASSYTAPLHDDYIGNVSSFHDGSASEVANFSHTAGASNGDGTRTVAVSTAFIIPDAPVPPPKTPIIKPRKPIPTLQLFHRSDASF